jgi:NADPH:quinone reductase-like Zn-dependent oxidoreductase
MRGYFVTHELLEGRLGSAQLAALVDLAVAGALRTEIDLQVPWTEAPAAVEALLERRVRGKAVMLVG